MTPKPAHPAFRAIVLLLLDERPDLLARWLGLPPNNRELAELLYRASPEYGRQQEAQAADPHSCPVCHRDCRCTGFVACDHDCPDRFHALLDRYAEANQRVGRHGPQSPAVEDAERVRDALGEVLWQAIRADEVHTVRSLKHVRDLLVPRP